MSVQSAEAALNNALSSYLAYLATHQTVTVSEVVAEETVVTPVVMRFSLADIFEKVKMRTAKAGKVAKGPKGESLFDAFAVTNDDKDWFDMVIKDAATNVYPTIAHLAKETAGYILDDGPTLIPYDNGAGDVTSGSYYTNAGKIYLCIKDASDPNVSDTTVFTEQPYWIDSHGYLTVLIVPVENMNGAMLSVAEISFMDALTSFLLTDWWKHVVADVDRAGLAKIDYDNAISKMKGALYFRNVPMKKKGHPWG